MFFKTENMQNGMFFSHIFFIEKIRSSTLVCMFHHSSPPTLLGGWITIGSSQSNRTLLAQLEQKMLPAAISV